MLIGDTRQLRDRAWRGRAFEYAKLAVRTSLFRFNLDLGRDPYTVRVARTLAWVGADTVLDIGANIGQYGASLRASGFRGKLVSCEPLPDAFAHLSRRAARDGNWIVVPTAVGESTSSAILNVAANSFSSSIRPMTAAHLESAPGSEFISTEQVSITTVVDLMEQHNLDPKHTLLKIDTQGYETPVLDGAADLLQAFAAIQVELSLVELYAGEDLCEALTDRLMNLGFALYAIEPGYPDRRTGRMMQYDALFVRRDLLPSYGDGDLDGV
jgi:FkbM family methyltransferase